MAKPKSISSEELMRRIQVGIRQDLSMLMRRYANSLLTFLTRMTGDHHLSEELFQEVFLTVWMQRKNYEYPRSFRSWLFGIAANKCRHEIRSQSRRPTSTLGGNLGVSIAPSTPEIVVEAETAALVEQAVLRLPEYQREVVVLRIWNSLSYQAISTILDRPEGSVRSQMHHALNRIRKYLEPKLRDPL